MSLELIGIIVASIALGGLMISLFGRLKSDVGGLQDGFAQIRERVAHIEGLLKGLRDSITAGTG